MKSVEITIKADGDVTIEAIGFASVGCAAATKDLELVLAGGAKDNIDKKPKPDYWQSYANKATVTR